MRDEAMLDDILRCCAAWEPDARVLGNVRAGDVLAAITALRAERDALAKKLEELDRPTSSDSMPLSRLTDLQANEITALRAERDVARDLWNRWMQAALYAAPLDALAFDPMSPEAFAASRRHAIDGMLAERDALRAERDSLAPLARLGLGVGVSASVRGMSGGRAGLAVVRPGLPCDLRCDMAGRAG